MRSNAEIKKLESDIDDEIKRQEDIMTEITVMLDPIRNSDLTLSQQAQEQKGHTVKKKFDSLLAEIDECYQEAKDQLSKTRELNKSFKDAMDYRGIAVEYKTFVHRFKGKIDEVSLKKLGDSKELFEAFKARLESITLPSVELPANPGAQDILYGPFFRKLYISHLIKQQCDLLGECIDIMEAKNQVKVLEKLKQVSAQLAAIPCNYAVVDNELSDMQQTISSVTVMMNLIKSRCEKVIPLLSGFVEISEELGKICREKQEIEKAMNQYTQRRYKFPHNSDTKTTGPDCLKLPIEVYKTQAELIIRMEKLAKRAKAVDIKIKEIHKQMDPEYGGIDVSDRKSIGVSTSGHGLFDQQNNGDGLDDDPMVASSASNSSI